MDPQTLYDCKFIIWAHGVQIVEYTLIAKKRINCEFYAHRHYHSELARKTLSNRHRPSMMKSKQCQEHENDIL